MTLWLARFSDRVSLPRMARDNEQRPLLTMERTMRSRTSLFAHAAWLTTLLAGLLPISLPLATTARAQQTVRVPTETAPQDEEVAQILQQGQQLERNRRWSEAITHYEEAYKAHPDRRDLQDRVTLAKAHYDVNRRYGDESFRSFLADGEQAALNQYSEILQKIHTHYVQAPNWHDLLRRGTFMLEVALTEPSFLEMHVPNASAEAINNCRRELRNLTDSADVKSRQDARNAVEDAVRVARLRLQLPRTATVLEYTCGAMSALDEYSGFLTQAQLDDVFGQIEGNFVGLGIELKAEPNALRIVNVITGSPAEKGGLKRGEHILRVDNTVVAEVSGDAAADLLKGPEGSTVALEVVDTLEQTRRVELLRERVEVPSVEDVRIIDPDFGVGYFKLTSFQKTTSRDVDTALWKLHRDGMKSLIIDVRGNPGGLLNSSVEVADKFLSSGTIVRTHGRNTTEDFEYKAHSVGTWRVPLVVLIDGDSASASEIFAGAIHDHRRGQIVGQRSYGKGSVQGIFPLASSDAGVRLTTAKFFSPSGQAISHRGVTPTIPIHVTRTGSKVVAAKPAIDAGNGSTTSAKVPEAPTDATLAAGINAARTYLSQRADAR